MLKSANDTKAFWASSTLFSSISTYTVKVDKATCKIRSEKVTKHDKKIFLFCLSLAV